jgi:CBS domain-containing protein
VPVLDGNDYVGMISSEDLQRCDPEQWSTTHVVEVVHADWPLARPDWILEQAVRTMEGEGVDSLPVLAKGGAFVGVVTEADIVRLDQILSQSDEEPDADQLD